MVKFTLTIESGNAALVDDPQIEVARILRETADRVEAGRTTVPLIDLNGNRVGTAELVVD